MTLPSFVLTGKVQQVGKDSADAGIDQDTTVLTGWTGTLTSNYPKGMPVPDGDDIGYIRIRTITLLDDGSITEDGVTAGISLTAHDPDLFDTPLQWTLKPGQVVLDSGATFRPNKWTFNAPLDGVDSTLGELTPVASQSMTSVARGLTGHSLSRIRRVANTLVSTVGGVDIGDPVDISDFVISTLTFPETFGAVGNGTTNDATALNACFAAAAGKTVWLDPSKTYAHNSLLTIGQDGTTVTGGGTLKATNAAAQQSAVIASGDNVTIDRVTLTCPTAAVRRSTLEDCKLALTGDGQVARNVTIDGSSNFGLTAYGATNFRIDNPTIRNTMADGLHVTNGSAHGVITTPTTDTTGDDGIAVVSYVTDGAPCEDIRINGFKVKNSAARGVSVVGGTNIRYGPGDIDGTAAAALYVACETGFATYGVSDVVMANVGVANANSGAPTVTNGAILVYNDRNTPYSIAEVNITDIRMRDTDVDADRQVSLQKIGTGTVTDIHLGPMTFSGTVPANILHLDGVSASNYVNNIGTAALTAKTTPVDADVFAGADSAASGKPVRFPFSGIKAAIMAAIVGAAPGTLDTLDELAAALGDDANYAATITTALGTKAPLASPAFTGTPTGVIAPGTHAATSKSSLVDADEFPVADSAASFGLKKSTVGDLKSAINPAVYQPVDEGHIAWSFDPAMIANSVAPGAGFLVVAKVPIRKAATITNVILNFQVAGSVLTAGRNFAALYNSAGALLATTADQTTAWGTAGVKVMALSAPQSVTPQVVYVGYFANGTTPPTIFTAPAAPEYNATVGRGGYDNVHTGLTTAPPATLGSLNQYNLIWAGVS